MPVPINNTPIVIETMESNHHISFPKRVSRSAILIYCSA
jgi:hypothetical protein